ncbi:hypothetical protein HJ123_17585 [Vibrio parahaemolyticus]|nr:hypothetical protein [Vibrio parahaemolyticus]
MELHNKVTNALSRIMAGKRSDKLIVPRITTSAWSGDLHLDDWGFRVPFGMRDALDIKFTPRVVREYFKVGQKMALPSRLNIRTNDKAREKKALISSSNSRIWAGHKPTVERVGLSEDDYLYLTFCMAKRSQRLVWTQGAVIAFKRGDTIPSTNGKHVVSVKYADPMGLVVKSRIGDSGDYETYREMDFGFVCYELFKKGPGESLTLISEGKLNQMEFLSFLVKGIEQKEEDAHTSLVNSLMSLNQGECYLSLGDGVVFSGDFGDRLRDYEDAARRKGLRVKGNISKLCRVVVIADKPSHGWKHGAFGLKVERAIEMRNAGADIFFMNEKMFASSVGEMSDAPIELREHKPTRKNNNHPMSVSISIDDLYSGEVVQADGMRIALTGTFELMQRKELERLLAQKYNFVCKKAIAKDTKLLVVGDKKADYSAKLLNAQKLGVEVLTESEFLEEYPV